MFIECYCPTCQREVRLELAVGANKATLDCPLCASRIGAFLKEEGWIYVLSNPSMPDHLKIGRTTRPVRERVQELSAATGIPTPFQTEAYFASFSLQEDEVRVHVKLSQYRTTSNREFFKVDLATAIKEIRAILPNSPEWLAESNRHLQFGPPNLQFDPAIVRQRVQLSREARLTENTKPPRKTGFNIDGFSGGL